MPRIFIDGEAGTTGLDIRARLDAAGITVISLDPARRKDPHVRIEMMHAADLVILCLPDDASREIVRQLGPDSSVRLLDASSAHRVDPDWVYGFPELDAAQSNRIATARRVSNPGCYPTGATALLKPLLSGGLISSDYPVTINAVSGYSGGGRQAIAQHEAEGGPAFELYALTLNHKHVAEIQMFSGLKHRPLFVPSVGHFAQGMIVSIPLHRDLLKNTSSRDLLACLKKAYAGKQHVVVMEDKPMKLDAAQEAGKDKLELRVHADTRDEHVLLTACLDNLGKGAGGAAVQNMRLMLGMTDGTS